MPKVCVLFAEGFEEIEAIAIVDVLRRAEIEVTTLGVSGRSVTGAHSVTVEADATLEAGGDRTWDMVILPGGMPGSTHLRDDPRVQALVKSQAARGGKIGAICAAPIALAAAGLLKGRRATSYPGFQDHLTGVQYQEERVVNDDGMITSRGPGTAIEFAIEIVRELRGAETAEALRAGMLVAS